MEITLDEIVVTPETSSFPILPFLIGIYGLIVSVLSMRFLYGMYKIFQLSKTGRIEKKSNYYLVKNSEVHSPFSFFNYLFWSESLDLESNEKEKILTHELTHIRGGHSWDVVLFEIMSIVFWFNPIIFLYKNSIRNVHEYLADANVLKTMHKKQYGQLLLKQLQSGFKIALANNFNHSQLKKRFTMIMKNKSSRPALLKYLWLLPIAAVMFMAFSSNKIQAQLNHSENLLETIESGDFDPEKIEQELRDLLEKYKHGIEDDKKNTILAGIIFLVERYPEHRKEVKSLVEKVIKEKNLPLSLFKTDEDTYCLYSDAQNQVLKSNGDSIYQTVDEMPLFPGCELTGDAKVDKECSDYKMLTYVYKNIKYPETARKNGTQGVVVIRFVVDKTGKVGSPEIKKSIGDGCDETVLDIVKRMPNWLPGKQDGKAVNVYFNLPVKFKMDDSLGSKAVEKTKHGEAVEKQHKIKNETTERDGVFKKVDKMPRLQGCDDLEGDALKNCSNNKLLDFVYKNVKYPEAARENGTEGTVVVNFVIDTDGSVILPKIVRSVGDGCDEVVLGIIGKMSKWVPGKKDGKVVKTEFNLPVKFKLAEDEKSSKKKSTNQLLLKNFTASPNPTSGKVNVQFESEKGKIRVEAVDQVGKKFYSSLLDEGKYDGQFNTNIDLSGAAKGPIFITITQNGKVFTEKIILQ